MSFFYDVLNVFNEDEQSESLRFFCLPNKGVMFVGKLKIMHFSDEEIIIKSKNKIIKIEGENLLIKTLSKGEITIFGTIKNINL